MKKHKYFRNKKYKNSLINRDPNFKSPLYFYSDSEYYWNERLSRYEYYEKPSVKYSTILKRNKFSKKWYRTQLNRKLRHNKKPYKNNEYRRLEELWWWID